MANKSMKMALLASAAALFVSTQLPAADAPAEGPKMQSGANARTLSMTCAGCHGTDGLSVGPASPTIAGLEGEYFVEVMQGFKNDEVYGTIMNRIAKGYTEEEIALMATYFAGKEFKPAKQEFDAELAKKGLKLHDKYCEKCHSEGGKVIEEDEYYILAGQWTPYLQYAMTDFREGNREMPKKMKKKLDKLIEKEGDKGLEALYAFYASQQ
jgi:sulfide dehydrogenase cytochrome subunit